MADNVPNYLRNLKTANARTLRIEVVGGVSETERHFLDGLAHFAAGTMSKNDEAHTTYVAEIMTKMIQHILKKLRNEQGDK